MSFTEQKMPLQNHLKYLCISLNLHTAESNFKWKAKSCFSSFYWTIVNQSESLAVHLSDGKKCIDACG